ncbi:hypothetical protein [Legionella sp. km772]|uniref:hypothetical protein n=1 Tax=Legionella sp. km772 TaxID=2498111 RepID=UPI000F8F66A5|nr:hypothetical protein [Legionella sp. km772]RUR09873.1 hypothetical protein ELY15_08795 [Legionella sp. km772]
MSRPIPSENSVAADVLTPNPAVKINALKAAELIKKDFLTSHHYYAKQQSLDGINHVIIYHNATLSLFEKKFDGSLVELVNAVTPALQTAYNVVKSIAHLSVWLTIILDSIVAKNEKDNKHLTELLSIKAHLALLTKCDDKLIGSELLALSQMNELIDKIIDVRSIKEIQKIQKQFLLTMSTANVRYSQRATELQLTGLEEILTTWLTAYKLNLKNSRVLVVCAHGPKQDLVETQYFNHLYKRFGLFDAEQLGYIIPVPMLTEQLANIDHEHLLNFLRRHQMNAQIGRQMLDDPTAMNRDVLGQYAPAVLKKQCPIQQISAVVGTFFATTPKDRGLDSQDPVPPSLK